MTSDFLSVSNDSFFKWNGEILVKSNFRAVVVHVECPHIVRLQMLRTPRAWRPKFANFCDILCYTVNSIFMVGLCNFICIFHNLATVRYYKDSFSQMNDLTSIFIKQDTLPGHFIVLSQKFLHVQHIILFECINVPMLPKMLSRKAALQILRQSLVSLRKPSLRPGTH